MRGMLLVQAVISVMSMPVAVSAKPVDEAGKQVKQLTQAKSLSGVAKTLAPESAAGLGVGVGAMVIAMADAEKQMRAAAPKVKPVAPINRNDPSVMLQAVGPKLEQVWRKAGLDPRNPGKAPAPAQRKRLIATGRQFCGQVTGIIDTYGGQGAVAIHQMLAMKLQPIFQAGLAYKQASPSLVNISQAKKPGTIMEARLIGGKWLLQIPEVAKVLDKGIELPGIPQPKRR